MSDGKTHVSATVGLALIALAVPQGISKVYFSLGVLAGAWLSPDLDVDQGFIMFRVLRRSTPFWWLYRAYWYPYARLVKHRSWVSHFPGVGTMIRLVYAFLPGILVQLVYGGFQIWESPAFPPFLLGLLSHDLLHFLMDRGTIRS